MFRNKRIMIVAAHPDDELLGLGATMHKIIKEQDAVVHVVILGEGITSRSDTRDKEKWCTVLNEHHANMKAAAVRIGFSSINSYDFADNRFDSHALLDIVKIVEKEKNEFRPDIIFTHNPGDLNIDHRYTFQAVMTATRPMVEECVTAIICFETPSATDWQYAGHPEQFKPNLFIGISEDDLIAKCEAMKEYKYENRDFPHPRSSDALKTLAKFRGYTSGHFLAEAFEVVRMKL